MSSDLGTLVRKRSEPPGSICAVNDPGLLDRIRNVQQAVSQAGDLSGPAIRRHTGDEFQILISGLVPGLLLALGGLLATTLAGGAIGAFFGGVGAGPGAAIGFEIGLVLLNYLGIGFLAVYIMEKIGEVFDAFKNGIRIAWNSCGDRDSIELAAGQFAEGVGIFFRIVLQAFVLYLTKAASEARVGSAIEKLNNSFMFRKAPMLKDWLLRNYRRVGESRGWVKTPEMVAKFRPPNTRTYQYDMVNNPGPLAPANTSAGALTRATPDELAKLRGSPAGNFIGGKYNEVILEQATVLYRAQPAQGTIVTITETGTSQVSKTPEWIGRWFAPEPPASGAIARIDNALKHLWIDADGIYTGTSAAEVVLAVKIPAGTKVYYGPVGSQGGVYVGGADKIQVFIPNLHNIPGVQVLTRTQIQAPRTGGVVDALTKN